MKSPHDLDRIHPFSLGLEFKWLRRKPKLKGADLEYKIGRAHV